jgi:hypothetical protein
VENEASEDYYQIFEKDKVVKVRNTDFVAIKVKGKENKAH